VIPLNLLIMPRQKKKKSVVVRVRVKPTRPKRAKKKSQPRKVRNNKVMRYVQEHVGHEMVVGNEWTKALKDPFTNPPVCVGNGAMGKTFCDMITNSGTVTFNSTNQNGWWMGMIVPNAANSFYCTTGYPVGMGTGTALNAMTWAAQQPVSTSSLAPLSGDARLTAHALRVQFRYPATDPPPQVTVGYTTSATRVDGIIGMNLILGTYMNQSGSRTTVVRDGAMQISWRPIDASELTMGFKALAAINTSTDWYTSAVAPMVPYFIVQASASTTMFWEEVLHVEMTPGRGSIINLGAQAQVSVDTGAILEYASTKMTPYFRYLTEKAINWGTSAMMGLAFRTVGTVVKGQYQSVPTAGPLQPPRLMQDELARRRSLVDDEKEYYDVQRRHQDTASIRGY